MPPERASAGEHRPRTKASRDIEEERLEVSGALRDHDRHDHREREHGDRHGRRSTSSGTALRHIVPRTETLAPTQVGGTGVVLRRRGSYSTPAAVSRRRAPT
jgi:hypothetical protein